MPIKWTADKDQRLLLLALELGNVDKKAIAELWAKKYGMCESRRVPLSSPHSALTHFEGNEESEQPAVRAIEEHLKALKKMAGGSKGGKATSGPLPAANSVSSTPRKANMPKTPSSSAKRARTKAMSDEDDSEDERAMAKEESPTKRAKYDRRSKTPKSYHNGDSADEDDLEEIAEVKPVVSGCANNIGGLSLNGVGSIFDQDLNLDGVAEAPIVPRKRTMAKDVDTMSEVSDYQPGLEFH